MAPVIYPDWVKDNSPGSVRHRLRCSAIAFSATTMVPVVISPAEFMDVVNVLDIAAQDRARREASEGRASRVAVRLQSLVDAEERGWRWAYLLLGLAMGTHLADVITDALRWLNG